MDRLTRLSSRVERQSEYRCPSLWEATQYRCVRVINTVASFLGPVSDLAACVVHEYHPGSHERVKEGTNVAALLVCCRWYTNDALISLRLPEIIICGYLLTGKGSK